MTIDRIGAEVKITLDEPHALTDLPYHVPFLAREVMWEHVVADLGDGEHREFCRAVAFGTCEPGKGVRGTDRTNTEVWNEGEPVPEWLPTPPDGWDLGVRIEMERRAVDAEAAMTAATN